VEKRVEELEEAVQKYNGILSGEGAVSLSLELTFGKIQSILLRDRG
jgi:hypothetical protein